MLKVEEMFERKEKDLIGKNPRTGEPIVLKVNVWTAEGLEIGCSKSLLEAMLKVELTKEEIEEISGMFKAMIKDTEWLSCATEEDIVEVNKAIEILKSDMSEVEKCFVLNIVDSQCLCAFDYCYGVEQVAGYIGKVMASIWGKLYVESDEDEEDE